MKPPTSKGIVVYILECADGSLYTGSTNNLAKRLREHNESKRGAHYTKIRRPVKLLYTETFPARGGSASGGKTLARALRREGEIKSWNRRKKLMLIKFNV